MKMWIFTQKIGRFKFGISRLAVTKNKLSGRWFSPLPLILSWFLLFRRIKPDIFLFFLFLIPNRTLKRRPMTGNAFLQAQRRKYQNKSILMTAVTIGAFLLSWSPYALVSLTATVKGHHVMTSGESEIPELMAKASVIYNPIIYTFINDKFRHTLWGILSGNRGIVLPRGRSGSEEPTEHGSVNATHASPRDH